MGDLLDKLVSEKEQETKKLKLSENKALAEIIGGFEKVLNLHFDLEKCVNLISNFSINYDSKDITLFSRFLNKYTDEDFISVASGLYLNALIDKCDSKNYKVYVNHLDFQIDYLGYRLAEDKKLKIIGNVGKELGGSAHGKIILKGNARHYAGCDFDGKMVIYGNVGDNLGYEMGRGVIIVRGNVGDCCGLSMAGGKIKIYGNAGEDLGEEMSSGIIEVKGKISSISDTIELSDITEYPDKYIIEKYFYEYDDK